MKRLFVLVSASMILSFAGSSFTDSVANVTGKASWYGHPFHGRLMANGKTYNMNNLTCAVPVVGRRPAHRFGTKLEVTNLNNKKKVIVTVTDTGSFAKYGRVLDLSKSAFGKIANHNSGVIKVSYRILN